MRAFWSQLLCVVLLVLPLLPARAADALPSWREGPAKTELLAFVSRTTSPGSADFVPEAERLAVIDQDGTLWPEHPLSPALRYAVERVRELAPDNPHWYRREPYRSVLEQQNKRNARLGERELLQLMLATHAGMTQDEYERRVRTWLAASGHAHFERPLASLVYQPMRELLQLLQAHGYRCFIYANGGSEFTRSFSESLYGLAPERIIGNQVKMDYQLLNGRPELVRGNRVHWLDERSGKAASVLHHLGRRPRLVVGNGDSDETLMDWSAAGSGARLVLRLYHDDAQRDYVDGRSVQLLPEQARARGWLPVSVREDWLNVFAPLSAMPALAP